MRSTFLFCLLFSVNALFAQAVFPVGSSAYGRGYQQPGMQFGNDSLPAKKWSVNRFGSIATSFTFFKGGSATILSAPVGFQLNRALNKNLYAFANIALAPAYVNFNHSFINTNTAFNKGAPGNFFRGTNSVGLYSAASMGLMYVNDEKTFSVSGSISIERSNSPLFPMYPTNNMPLVPPAAKR